MLKTTYDDVQLITAYMWPNTKFTPPMLHQLRCFINASHKKLGCCVIHRLSRSYKKFASEFGMPSVADNQEVIICKDGTVQFTPHTFLKGIRKIHKIESTDGVKVIKL